MTSAINVTTPDGTCGPWSIESFEITKEGADSFNLRLAFQGMPQHHYAVPGKYKKLMHKDRGVVMSNTPMEVRTNTAFINAAKGHVLINGLGLGMVLHAIMDKPEVTKVTVVELDLDVIALTAPHFREHIESGRLHIINADCFKHVPPKGERYDVVWHDIWDTISDENLFEMTKLRLKYAKRTKLQLCWAEADCKSMRASIDALLRLNGKTYKGFREFLKERGDI